MSATVLDTDVVVVGAGPVGSTLAVDLGISGVRAVILESRSQSERPHPGTNLTNVRSMEHFRRYGATDLLAECNPVGADIPRDVQFVTRGTGPTILNMVGALDFVEPLPISSAKPRFGPQESIEDALRTRAGEFAGIEFRYGAFFTHFVEYDDHVAIFYERDGVEECIAARYVVGADGSRSGVRRQLGIKLEGTPRIAHMSTWYIRSPELRELLAAHGHNAAMVWWANEDHSGAIVIPQDSEGVFQYADGPIPDDVDGGDWALAKARLFRDLGAEVEVEPLDGGDLWLNSLVAPTFQSGRAFLAGESCHLISVFGGFGMNTGVGDVADLGWKLAASVHGWAGDGLLASYSADRVPVVKWVRDLTEESTKHLGYTFVEPGMEADTPTGEAIRNEIAGRIIAEKQRELISLGAQFGAALYYSPIIVGDGTIPPLASFGEFVPTASPGARLPHVWLDLAADHSLYDEIAHEGFTVVRTDASADASRLEAAAKERNVPVRVVTVERADVHELYGASLLLVRPDHYVAWRGSEVPEDALALIDRVRGA